MKHYSFILLIFLTAGLFSSCGSKSDDPVPEPPIVIGIPTNLMTTPISQGIRLTWSRVDSIDRYQVSILNDTVYTTNTWYDFDVSLHSDLGYGTQYTWKVRALKGTAAGDWATSTLTTPPTPVALEFIGTWDTDSISVDASMSGNTFPVETFLPNGSAVPSNQDIHINIDENPGSDNSVLFTIIGIDSLLPVDAASLNQVTMTSNSDGTIGGSQNINYTYTYTLDTPLLLSSLPNYDQIIAQAGVGSLLVDSTTAIEAVTITVTNVSISGAFNSEDNSKAIYTISTDAPINITTNKGDSFDSLLYQFFLKNNPLDMKLTIYSTKKQV